MSCLFVCFSERLSFEAEVFIEEMCLLSVICGKMLFICLLGFALSCGQSGGKRGRREGLKRGSGDFDGSRRLLSGMFPAT